MILKIENKTVEFKIIPLKFLSRDISSVYYSKNNKTLSQTFEHYKYSRIKILLADKYIIHKDKKLGNFLQYLKDANDNNYLYFLNKYGDNKFCEFKISENLSDKGIYCFIVGDIIKYVGRCTDSFKKRINQGYGKINPKNCFIDGQATNCHINSLINSTDNIRLGIYPMTDKSSEEIKEMERLILSNNRFEWNIQTL